MERRETASSVNFLVVIAHYNHNATLRRVAQDCKAVWPHILVVDDGSDVSPEESLKGVDVSFIRQTPNMGKGAAILAGADWARKYGFTHIITIDADAQHKAEDMTLLMQEARQNLSALVIGVRRFDSSVPFSSRFGRKFGNFWVHLQTGKAVGDIQSGYRCYPVEVLRVLKIWNKRYAFEVEVVVRALWAGFDVRECPVPVVYAKERISHFSKIKDNFRLTLLNTYLTVRSMIPVSHRKYIQVEGRSVPQSYLQTLRDNLSAPGSALRNAVSAAWGIFCGSLALPGLRQLFLFGGAGWWNLNRLLCVAFEKLCIGPFIPAVCIEAGYFMRNGRFLTQFDMTTLGRQALQRIWEWLLGSLIVAPFLACCTFLTVFVIGYILSRGIYGRS
ncbi:MAG: glycosyltransferase family 2 protein [Elusimicrobiaceae bacterium]